MSHRLLLIIEDEMGRAGGLVLGLREASFDVELVTDAHAGVKSALAGAFDAVVVDVHGADPSDLTVLERLRAKISSPVVVLSARGTLDHRLACFELGAADYMAKPFWVEELSARLRTRLGLHSARPRRTMRWGDVVVDVDARAVRVDGRDVNLTRHEFDVLLHLIDRAGRAVSRDLLAERALTPFEERDARTVDSHIARIRKKLGASGATRIVTVWGIGYRFEAA